MESKTGRVGQVTQCKSTSGCRETGRGKVNMCDGEKWSEEVLPGGGGKPTAPVGLSVYRKGKGNRRVMLLMGNKSAFCFQRLLLFCWSHSYFLQATLESKQPMVCSSVLS